MVGQNKYIGSASSWVFSQYAYYYDPDTILTASNVTAFPMTGVPRSYANSLFIPTDMPNDVRSWWWIGKMADGSDIKAGQYVMRVAALRPFGDRTKSSDWDAWPLSFTATS